MQCVGNIDFLAILCADNEHVGHNILLRLFIFFEASHNNCSVTEIAFLH